MVLGNAAPSLCLRCQGQQVTRAPGLLITHRTRLSKSGAGSKQGWRQLGTGSWAWEHCSGEVGPVRVLSTGQGSHRSAPLALREGPCGLCYQLAQACGRGEGIYLCLSRPFPTENSVLKETSFTGSRCWVSVTGVCAISEQIFLHE